MKKSLLTFAVLMIAVMAIVGSDLTREASIMKHRDISNGSVTMFSNPNPRNQEILPPINVVYWSPIDRRNRHVAPPIVVICDPSRHRNAIKITGLSEIAQVTIYNMLGKEIQKTETSEYISTERMSSGTYILRIATGSNVVTGKVTLIK